MQDIQMQDNNVNARKLKVEEVKEIKKLYEDISDNVDGGLQVMMRSLKSRGGLTRGRGITESVRLLWLGSMHRCAGVHDAMTTLTNTH